MQPSPQLTTDSALDFRPPPAPLTHGITLQIAFWLPPPVMITGPGVAAPGHTLNSLSTSAPRAEVRNPNPVDSSRGINPLDSSCSAELVENPVMTHALSTLVGRFELELRMENRVFSEVKIPIFLHAWPLGPVPLCRSAAIFLCGAAARRTPLAAATKGHAKGAVLGYSAWGSGPRGCGHWILGTGF